MEIYKLKSLSAEERRGILEGEAWEEQVYMQPLSEEELAERQRELAQACIQQEYILDEKKEVMEGFKDRLKPIATKISESISAIRNRAVEVTGPIYKISDFDNQMIHNVDPLGNVLGSRRMKPEERQLSITHSISKAV